MNRTQAAALVIVGVAIGCGAAEVVPMAASHAQASPGKWDCFVVDRLPNLDDARAWDGAVNIRKGLDLAAANVAAGTMLSVTLRGGGAASVACVKD